MRRAIVGREDALAGGGGSVPVRVGQPRHREIEGAVVPLTRPPVDRRASRIPEPQQPRHLVVRLPRRIVSRPPDALIFAGARHEVQARVPARDDENGGRHRQFAVGERQRFDVAGQVMHGDDRDAARPCHRLGERDPDKQRSHQARSLRDGHRAEVVHRRAAGVEGGFDHAADVADVLPRRQLRHHAAPLAVNRNLGGHDIRPERPRTRRLPRFGQEGGRGLVARCLDGEQVHERIGGRPSRLAGC